MADGSRDKKERKDSQLLLRINSKDRDDFVALCEALDTTAAREIRGFIRKFVASHALPKPPPQSAGDIRSEIADSHTKKRKSKQGKKGK